MNIIVSHRYVTHTKLYCHKKMIVMSLYKLPTHTIFSSRDLAQPNRNPFCSYLFSLSIYLTIPLLSRDPFYFPDARGNVPIEAHTMSRSSGSMHRSFLRCTQKCIVQIDSCVLHLSHSIAFLPHTCTLCAVEP